MDIFGNFAERARRQQGEKSKSQINITNYFEEKKILQTIKNE
jgi:hypothetical protein